MDNLDFVGAISLDEYRRRLRASKRFHTYEDLAGNLLVNHYYLWNILNDVEYRPPAWICRRLGIEYNEPITVEPCKRCGAPHPPLKVCQRQATTKRHRIAISKVDPASAARSIRDNCYYSASELIEELKR